MNNGTAIFEDSGLHCREYVMALRNCHELSKKHLENIILN